MLMFFIYLENKLIKYWQVELEYGYTVGLSMEFKTQKHKNMVGKQN
jgi:hypothetical protein